MGSDALRNKNFQGKAWVFLVLHKKEIELLVTELNKLKTNKINLGDELRLPKCPCMSLSTYVRRE